MLSTRRSLDRRDLLRLGGVALCGAVAGCRSESPGSTPGEPEPEPEPEPTESPQSSPTPDTSSPSAESGGPATCPPAPGGEFDVTVHCGPRRPDQSVWMSTSAGTLEMPRDELQFTLHNESDHALSSEDDRYRFYHWRDGEWFLIREKTDDGAFVRVRVPSGETRDWRVIEDTRNLGPTLPPGAPARSQSRDEGGTFVFRLPPGVYAFGFDASGARSTTSRTASTPPRHRYTAQIDVEGEPLSLRPSNAVDETFRREETLVVRTQPYRERFPEEFFEQARRMTLIADRRSTAPDRAARLGLFELYNPGHELHPAGSDREAFVPTFLTGLLRDGLVHYEGSASRIRMETKNTIHPPLGLAADESLPVVYEGTPWRLTAENGWLDR